MAHRSAKKEARVKDEQVFGLSGNECFAGGSPDWARGDVASQMHVVLLSRRQPRKPHRRCFVFPISKNPYIETPGSSR